MRVLLTGGSACGKSTFAEQLALRFPAPRVYIATMRAYDDECARKIERHRAQRGTKDFITVERDTGLAGLSLPMGCTALLECMCNLTANEMFDEKGGFSDPYDRIMDGIAALERQCGALIVVTNDVGGDKGDYGAATRAYIDTLGRLNAALAARFENVYELVCGIPVVLKGELL